MGLGNDRKQKNKPRKKALTKAGETHLWLTQLMTAWWIVLHRILLYSYSLLMNEERFASRRLLRLLLVSASGSSSFGAISHVRRLLRLYFASDTLFLVTFHLGFSSSVLCFHGGVFLRLRFLFLFFDDESLALVPMHTAAGGNKLFCFSVNEHVLEKKRKNYTQFLMHFFPSDTTTLGCIWVVSFCLLAVRF